VIHLHITENISIITYKGYTEKIEINIDYAILDGRILDINA